VICVSPDPLLPVYLQVPLAHQAARDTPQGFAFQTAKCSPMHSRRTMNIFGKTIASEHHSTRCGYPGPVSMRSYIRDQIVLPSCRQNGPSQLGPGLDEAMVCCESGALSAYSNPFKLYSPTRMRPWYPHFKALWTTVASDSEAMWLPGSGGRRANFDRFRPRRHFALTEVLCRLMSPSLPLHSLSILTKSGSPAHLTAYKMMMVQQKPFLVPAGCLAGPLTCFIISSAYG
jgi:hypothetical protein